MHLRPEANACTRAHPTTGGLGKALSHAIGRILLPIGCALLAQLVKEPRKAEAGSEGSERAGAWLEVERRRVQFCFNAAPVGYE
eukprot:6184624-Pleurochrysis_carterae.AAC.1